jgi:antitoxin component HigA of HigAB toxin-antitoxin module
VEIKPIKSEADYQLALKRLEQIFDSCRGTTEGDELELLSILIDNYELKDFPDISTEPVEAIKYRLEQLGIATDAPLKPDDLRKILGIDLGFLTSVSATKVTLKDLFDIVEAGSEGRVSIKVEA